jgi:hypothetical protein
MHNLNTLDVSVISERHIDGLLSFAWCEGNGNARRGIVASSVGRAVIVDRVVTTNIGGIVDGWK